MEPLAFRSQLHAFISPIADRDSNVPANRAFDAALNVRSGQLLNPSWSALTITHKKSKIRLMGKSGCTVVRALLLYAYCLLLLLFVPSFSNSAGINTVCQRGCKIYD